MVPEEVYRQNSECTPEERALLLALKEKYDRRTIERRRAKETCKQCLLVLGVNPNTGRSNHRRMKHLLSTCKGERITKRVKNKYSSEEAGTIGNYVSVMRWDNSYITKACYRKKMW